MSARDAKVQAPDHALLAPPAEWHDIEPHAHIVQFYSEDAYLIDSLSHFVRTALEEGDSAVVIGTREHRDALVPRLEARGLDIAGALRDLRYVAVDAGETLSKFMRNGMPDPAQFCEVIGGLVTQARAAGKGNRARVAMFGEMVALLWAEGMSEAAIRLERFWNDLARTHSLTLRCAYPITGFYRRADVGPFLAICAEHSGVVPTEEYGALDSEEGRLRAIALLQQQAQVLRGERALRDSEDRFRLFVEAVADYAIFMLDAEGRVATWNKGAQRIKGYEASEIIGRHFSCFYPQADLQAGKPQFELETAAKEGRFEDEGWRVRKDGSRFWANVVITALKDRDGHLYGYGKVTRDMTERMLAHDALQKTNQELHKEIAERKRTESKLLDSEHSLRRLSLHLLRTQDEERRRIGREMHDGLGQNLAVLKMSLDSLKGLPLGEEAARKIEQSIHLVAESITELRTISYLLYPPMLEELGLRCTIPWYLDGFAKRSGIRTTFDISRDLGRLPRDVELAAFRVLQESLTNVHRHSGSPTAHVRVDVHGGQVKLEVKDQGKGLPSEISERSSPDWLDSVGVGLRGMRERMEQLGGRLEVSSNQEGTTVTATLPIDESR